MTPKEFKQLRPVVGQEVQRLITQGGLPQYGGTLAAPITGAEQAILQQIGTGSGSPLAQQAGQTFGQVAANPGGQGFNPFAGPSELEQAGVMNIANQAFNPSAIAQGSDQALQAIISGQFMNAESNPYLQSAINAASRPLLEQFQDAQILQRQQFGNLGQQVGRGQSSPFDVAHARLSGATANALGDVSSNLAFQNYQNEANRQLQAIGLGQTQDANAFQRALGAQGAFGDLQTRQANAFEAQQGRELQGDQARLAAAQGLGQLDRSQLEQSLQALQAQALPRLIEQLGIDRGMQAYQQQQASLLQLLQQGGALASPTIATTPGTPASSGILGPLAQGIGTGLGGPLGGALASTLFG